MVHACAHTRVMIMLWYIYIVLFWLVNHNFFCAFSLDSVNSFGMHAQMSVLVCIRYWLWILVYSCACISSICKFVHVVRCLIVISIDLRNLDDMCVYVYLYLDSYFILNRVFNFVVIWLLPLYWLFSLFIYNIYVHVSIVSNIFVNFMCHSC